MSLLSFVAHASEATTEFSARSRPIRVAVIGDSLANDLGRGMEAVYLGGRKVEIVKHTRFATGLVRTDYFNWNDSVRQFLSQHRPHAIIVVIGGNDQQTIRTAGHRLDPMTRSWQEEYTRRVGSFMDILKQSRSKIFWVGLPVVRSPKMTHSFEIMNRIYRKQAAAHGIKFISVWDTFLAQDGGYSSFGMSLTGVKRKLRENDGMHFTEDGRLRLAVRVARAIGLR